MTQEIRPTDPDDPAAQYCLRQYFDLLAQKVPAVTRDHFPLPDPQAEAYRPPNGAFLVAFNANQPIGTVSLRQLDAQTGEVKRLWVAPEARGQGLARRLMQQIESQARSLGYQSLKLDTNAALTEAITLYKATGWQDTAPYTGFPATNWFTKTL